MLDVDNYHIVTNVRGAKFSRISIFRNFVETISLIEDSVNINAVFKHLAELNFRGSMPTVKNEKIMHLENLPLYVIELCWNSSMYTILPDPILEE